LRWAEQELLLELQRTSDIMSDQASPARLQAPGQAAAAGSPLAIGQSAAAAMGLQAAAAAAAVEGGLQPESAAGSQAGGFITIRSAPSAPAPPALPNLQQLDAEEDVSVRGVCDGCKQNVLSNDEGRKREGNKYYHEQCVKGMCGGCGRIVHADAERVKLSGVYWHRDCV
jgi:hypothetical protein